ncbi:LysR family transcriptional regulator [Shigella boydii]|nr:LysR family transcriptional regulator [Shigella flexneri]EGF3810297.1 LysR family transcriptional regulator [Shigella boydii]EGD8079357.1 LysR family transcriptional regulator [Shigella flexneri]MBC3914784.1 LysR family transcriptional regulator [Shigella flexneri]MBC6599881.1 LysR family transcriptional regulator [Shigella flexneri]
MRSCRTTRNFGGAAETLNLSQPALSKTLNEL